jgi:hypothetical protein
LQPPIILNFASCPYCFSVFLPGFLFVIHSHFHLSFTITSFAAFYFMDKLGLVLRNKQAFFFICSCLQHFKSTSVKLVSPVHFISCHFMFTFFHLTIFVEEIAIAIPLRCREAIMYGHPVVTRMWSWFI